ncbi:MAG: RNA polymerase sigma factor [Bacteroidales bacterium]
MREEKKLVKRCQLRDGKAFNKLYEKYAPVLFAICMRYGKNQAEAEDILQESFLTIFNKIETYRFEGSFEGWMKRITVNTAINLLRSKNHQLYRIKSDEYDQVKFEGYDAISKLNEEEILKCIQNLPVGYRTVFNLHVVEGYKHREIAELLMISENTSRTQLGKARQALIKEMEKLGYKL